MAWYSRSVMQTGKQPLLLPIPAGQELDPMTLKAYTAALWGLVFILHAVTGNAWNLLIFPVCLGQAFVGYAIGRIRYRATFGFSISMLLGVVGWVWVLLVADGRSELPTY